MPDVLHSYYALAGLALTSHPALRALEPRFGMTCRAVEAAGLRRAPRGEALCEREAEPRAVQQRGGDGRTGVQQHRERSRHFLGAAHLSSSSADLCKPGFG